MASVVAAYVLSFFQRFAPAGIASDLAAAFNTSASSLGALAATYFYVYTLMQVPTGILVDTADYEKLFKLDQWNDIIIIAKGNHIQHYLNGTLLTDFTDNDPALAAKDGIIALQLHAGKAMWTEFKDIRIKELGK